MQIPDLLFYRANKYVIITFGALQKKCRHAPLSTLSNASGTPPRVPEGVTPCHRHIRASTVPAPMLEEERGSRISLTFIRDWEKSKGRGWTGLCPASSGVSSEGEGVGRVISAFYRTPAMCQADTTSLHLSKLMSIFPFPKRRQIGLCSS